MSTDVCPGCKQPIATCYYGGDCLEVQAIFREQQKEQLADIDTDELGGCASCGMPIDRHYTFCHHCEIGLED